MTDLPDLIARTEAVMAISLMMACGRNVPPPIPPDTCISVGVEIVGPWIPDVDSGTYRAEVRQVSCACNRPSTCLRESP